MTFSQRVYATCCKRFNSVLERDANETVGTRLGKRFLNVVFIGFKTTLIFRKPLKPTESLTQTCYAFANCYGFGVLKTFSQRVSATLCKCFKSYMNQTLTKRLEICLKNVSSTSSFQVSKPLLFAENPNQTFAFSSQNPQNLQNASPKRFMRSQNVTDLGF